MTAHDDPWRPRCHFSAARHWINDPNGLVSHDGIAHLYFQHNPFANEWGHMSWGHATSADFVQWDEQPVAIAEDEHASIFSGSVVIDAHDSAGFGAGAWVAVYTASARVPQGGQAQSLAVSHDHGRTWTQFAGNPVLDLGLRDFRDPKVFWHGASARWVMAVVLPDFRCVRFYASTDLKRWSLQGEFAAPFRGDGIWECPDLLPITVPGEREAWLLKVDVLGGHPSGGSGARVFFGRFDGSRFTPEPAHAADAPPRWADHGADFYAALSWAYLPGTPTWIGWMNCHRYAGRLPTQPWRGAMSIPRTLAASRGDDGALRLHQQPVAVLAARRGRRFVRAAGTLQADESLLPADADGRALDITLTLAVCEAIECGLVLRAGDDGDEETRVGYDSARGTLFVDRSRSGFAPDALYARRREVRVRAPRPEAPLALRVLVDACSVEVFADGGATVLTELIFPRDTSRGARLYTRGGSARWGEVVVFELLG